MKKRILPAIALLFLGYFTSHAQVGIGTFAPDKSAELDVSSINKGLLVPRLSLTSTAVSTPIVGIPAQSLYVFNTSTTADVTPGFYYWDNSKWNRVLNSSDVSTLETLTTIGLNSDGHTLNYADEKGQVTSIDLATVISNFQTVTSLSFDSSLNTLTYNDEKGVSNAINVSNLVKMNETLTSLVDNSNGTFTYTNEKGIGVTYDVNAQIQKKAWSVQGNPDTDQTTDFLGTTDAKPLIIKTKGIERIKIEAEGNIGVNVPLPTSSYAVAGSESHSIKVISANYTATDKDHTLISRSTTSTTLTLPDPTTCIGRIYYLVNNGTNDLTLTPAIEMAAGITTNKLGTGSGTNGNVVFGNRIKIQSDGTVYIVIQ